MKIAKNDIPVQIDVPGATARQQKNFGDVTGYGTIGAEFFSFGAGTDITDLLHGLDGNLCQCPHWGYVLKGKMTTTDAAGAQESVSEGDLFYWPPGHTVKADADADIIMFSPEKEHTEVIEHIQAKIGG
jgi:hypothetical protein